MGRRPDLTPDVRQQVVKDYLAGVKAMVIQWQYKVSPGEMYRILHQAKVSLAGSLSAKQGYFYGEDTQDTGAKGARPQAGIQRP